MFDTDIHLDYTREVLTRMGFSEEAIERVEAGNAYVDRFWNFLANNEHSIRNTTPLPQSLAAAQAGASAFITENRNSAIQKGSNLSATDQELKDALWDMGKMLHTLQDEIAHEWIFIFEHALPFWIDVDLHPENHPPKPEWAVAATELAVQHVVNQIVQIGGPSAKARFMNYPDHGPVTGHLSINAVSLGQEKMLSSVVNLTSILGR